MADRRIDTGTDTLRVEVVDGVGVITLHRPHRRNALHDDMYDPMAAAIEAFAADDGVGAVVLTGAGTGFCAGGDVRDGSGRNPDGSRPSADERAARLAHNSRVAVLFYEAPVITIAAVNGAAVGAGLALALACDLRIAAASARFVTGWAALGFSGDFGGPWLLSERLGHGRALELLATNGAVDAATALELGLVDRLVDDGEFDAAWRQWATTLASGPRFAMGLMKQNVLNARRVGLAEAVAIEARHQVETTASPDHREGVRAWIEKRPPRFGAHLDGGPGGPRPTDDPASPNGQG